MSDVSLFFMNNADEEEKHLISNQIDGKSVMVGSDKTYQH